MRTPPRQQPNPPKEFAADQDFSKVSPASTYFLQAGSNYEVRPNNPLKTRMRVPRGSYLVIAQVNLFNPSINPEISLPFFECVLTYPLMAGRANTHLSGYLPRREDTPPYQVLLNACINAGDNAELTFIISISPAKEVVISAENLRITAIQLPSLLTAVS